jgi:aminopeptidase N
MTSDKAVIMENKVQTFTVPLSGADDYVKINAGQQALCRVAHSVEMTKRLQPAIKSKTIGPVDRAGLLLDAYALTKAGYASLESAVMLLKAFVAEDNSSVWTAVGGVLGGLHVLLEAAKDSSPDAEAAFANYVAFGGKLVKKALLMVGWDAKEGEGHSVKLLRSTVVGLLDVFCCSDEEVLAESRRRYAAHWSDASHTVLPGEYKSTVFRIVLKNGGDKEYEEILKSFYDTDDNAEKKYALVTLGATPSAALRARTLDWAVRSGEVKLQDFFYCIGSVAGSADGCRTAWEYYKANFAFIKDKLSKASGSLMDATIGSSVIRFCTLEQADEIEAFFKANPVKSSERRVTQILEGIRSNGAMLKRILASDLIKPSFWAVDDEPAHA